MTNDSEFSPPPARFCIECGVARQGMAIFCISCGTRFADVTKHRPQDLVAQTLDSDESVRDSATRQIIQSVDIDAMTRCGRAALDQADITAAEFWFMEVATAGADETVRADGIEDLCRLVYMPTGRLEEAELYTRHATLHPDARIRARALRTLADIEIVRAECGNSRLEYSEAWRRVDVTQPMPTGLTQAEHYHYLLAHLFARDAGGKNKELLDGLEHDYMQGITGFLIGLDRSSASTGRERDTAAKAVADWLEHR